MNTNYYLNCAAGNLFQSKTTPGIPENYYIGLSLTAPNIDGTGVSEPSEDAGYRRIKLTGLSEPVNGTVTNTQAINFDESSDDWGIITHYVIYDSPDTETGNLLMYDELSKPRTVEEATIMTIPEQSLKLSAQNPA